MNMKFAALIIACALAAAPLCRAQERDFLTEDEIDQIRLAQEPNLRLELYVQFAKNRIELVKQLMATPKAGRSLLIHDTLEDYTKIIDAIDTVADDALKRKLDISKGMATVMAGEKEMGATLDKLQQNPPQDYARYEFVMQQAAEATHDSAETSAEDLSQRTADVIAADEREKKERESLMTTKEQNERKAADAKTAPNHGRKAPSLLKPGEKPGPNQVQ